MPVFDQPTSRNDASATTAKENLGRIDRVRMRQIAFQFFRILGLLLLCIIIAILNRNFLKPTNLINILRQASPQIIISIGMTIVLLTGGIDLSVGSIMTVGSAVSGFFLTQTGVPWPVALVVALFTGTLLGLFSGALVAYVKLPAPIATYGMLWIGRGVSFGIMGSTPFFGFSAGFRYLGKGYLLGIPFGSLVPIMLEDSPEEPVPVVQILKQAIGHDHAGQIADIPIPEYSAHRPAMYLPPHLLEVFLQPYLFFSGQFRGLEYGFSVHEGRIVEEVLRRLQEIVVLLYPIIQFGSRVGYDVIEVHLTNRILEAELCHVQDVFCCFRWIPENEEQLDVIPQVAGVLDGVFYLLHRLALLDDL